MIITGCKIYLWHIRRNTDLENAAEREKRYFSFMKNLRSIHSRRAFTQLRLHWLFLHFLFIDDVCKVGVKIVFVPFWVAATPNQRAMWNERKIWVELAAKRCRATATWVWIRIERRPTLMMTMKFSHYSFHFINGSSNWFPSISSVMNLNVSSFCCF